jgi:hypothetical protein
MTDPRLRNRLNFVRKKSRARPVIEQDFNTPNPKG